MIIISARKFRDNQNEIMRHALTEEVILTTVHYGSFRLVPIVEGESTYSRPTVSPTPSAPVPSFIHEPVAAAVDRPSSPVTESPVQPSFDAPVESPELTAPEPIIDSYEYSKAEESAHSYNEELHDRAGEVYVDPSLLTLEEFYKQEGIDVPSKKKGIFSKFFNK